MVSAIGPQVLILELPDESCITLRQCLSLRGGEWKSLFWHLTILSNLTLSQYGGQGKHSIVENECLRRVDSCYNAVFFFCTG